MIALVCAGLSAYVNVAGFGSGSGSDSPAARVQRGSLLDVLALLERGALRSDSPLNVAPARAAAAREFDTVRPAVGAHIGPGQLRFLDRGVRGRGILVGALELVGSFRKTRCASCATGMRVVVARRCSINGFEIIHV